jgi:3-oxoadipate enol-lactonase
MHLNFVKEGRGPIIVLSHALGCDLRMWDAVAARWGTDYTVLRYDHRGHGKSEIVPGPYSIEDMADDAAALIEEHASGAVHFVGLSMGGMVAQQVAVRHPQLIASIVVANSSSYYDEAARAMWKARIESVRSQGMEAIADGVMQRWFTPEFRDDPEGAKRVAALRAVLVANDPKAYVDSCEAVSRIDFYGTNPRIACPALVIAGTRDESTPPAMVDALRKTISGAVLATLPTAHLSAVERPVDFANLAVEFIRGLE